MPTLAVMRARVNVKIGNTDSRKQPIDVVRVDHAIADACLTLGSQIRPPEVYLPSSFTISAGADTFTLATAAQTGYVSLTQYASDIRVRLTNKRTFLTKRSVEYIDSLRERQPDSYQAEPSEFCLWEEMDNDMQGRCWPRSREAEPCDVFCSLVLDDLRDAADMDAANVRFSRYGATSLVFHAAAHLVAAMSAKEVELRGINPNVVPMWQKDASVLMYQEEKRRNDAEGLGYTQRLVP